jgi:hypothetical protein
MKRQMKLFVLFSFFILPLVVGCKQLDTFSSEGSAPADAVVGTTGLSFQFDFSSLLSSQSSSSNKIVGQFSDGTAIHFTGNISFEAVSSGATSTYAISAAVDGDFEAKLEQTIALQGGQYNVSVGFSDSNQEYYGTASNVTITEDATNDIDITISPVIGDTVMTADISGSVPLYDFQYASSDFDTASDSYYMLVYLDGGSAVDFTFDEFTENALLYMNISDGTHNVKIEILKYGTPDVVIARYEGSSDFGAGTDMTLNLTPVFGTSTFTLSETGNDAVFDLTILEETYDIVNSETGGYFEYRFKASGTANSITEEVLFLSQDTEGDWGVTRTYSGFQYETMNAEVEVWNTATSDEIGNCTFTVDLSKNQTPVSCDLTLERRATISGEVLQVLGVNVVDETGDAAPYGTSVYIDGVFKGSTGGTGVTDGYTSLFLEPGATYSIHAVNSGAGTSSAAMSYTAESWKIDNILLRLDQ